MEFSENTLPPLKTTPELQKIWGNLGSLARILSIYWGALLMIMALVLIIGTYYLTSTYNRLSEPEEITPNLGATLYVSVAIWGGLLGGFFAIVREQFRFGVHIRRALRGGTQQDFEAAWRRLRNHFRWAGITTIVILALFSIAFMLIGYFERPYMEY